MSHHDNDERDKPGTANPAGLPEGFSSVMERVRNLNGNEAARLRERAESTVFGHEAYALGREYLECGRYEQATRWLQIAARHQVVGAQHDLDGLALRRALKITSDGTPASILEQGLAGFLTATAAGADTPGGPWPELTTAAAAHREVQALRAAAQQEADTVLADVQRRGRTILANARQEADRLLTHARAEAERVLAEARKEADRLRTSAPEKGSAPTFTYFPRTIALPMISLRPDADRSATAAPYANWRRRLWSPDENPSLTAGIINFRDVSWSMTDLRSHRAADVPPTAERISYLTKVLSVHSDDVFRREYWAATAGHPFGAVDLTEKVHDRGLRADEPSAHRMHDLATTTKDSDLTIRLELLGTSAVRMAYATAVLGTPVSLDIAARVAALNVEEAADAADRLRKARILAGGDVLEFVHPLIATAVYRGIPGALRTGMHGEAAWTIVDAGLGPSVAARHLLETWPEGDSWVVAQLRQAARDAARSGAPDTARRYLARALREPPSLQDRVAILIESAALRAPLMATGNFSHKSKIDKAAMPWYPGRKPYFATNWRDVLEDTQFCLVCAADFGSAVGSGMREMLHASERALEIHAEHAGLRTGPTARWQDLEPGPSGLVLAKSAGLT